MSLSSSCLLWLVYHIIGNKSMYLYYILHYFCRCSLTFRPTGSLYMYTVWAPISSALILLPTKVLIPANEQEPKATVPICGEHQVQLLSEAANIFTNSSSLFCKIWDLLSYFVMLIHISYFSFQSCPCIIVQIHCFHMCFFTNLSYLIRCIYSVDYADPNHQFYIIFYMISCVLLIRTSADSIQITYMTVTETLLIKILFFSYSIMVQYKVCVFFHFRSVFIPSIVLGYFLRNFLANSFYFPWHICLYLVLGNHISVPLIIVTLIQSLLYPLFLLFIYPSCLCGLIRSSTP